MKTLVIRALRTLAKRQIAKFQPTVVAITGSVGKTSTKQAIAIVLGSAYEVRSESKNYNNEFGVPLAIMGEYSPNRKAWEWVKLFARQLRVKTFPKYLVLEYSADKAGDIQALCDIATPHIGVLTAISPVHVANYKNFGALAEEKAVLGDNVPVDGTIILNVDDPTVNLMRDRFQASLATYGYSGKDAKIVSVQTTTKLDNHFAPGEVVAVTNAVIEVDGETASLELKNCLGNAPVAACAVALS